MILVWEGAGEGGLVATGRFRSTQEEEKEEEVVEGLGVGGGGWGNESEGAKAKPTLVVGWGGGGGGGGGRHADAVVGARIIATANLRHSRARLLRAGALRIASTPLQIDEPAAPRARCTSAVHFISSALR